jgi:hypothetical protein
MPRGSKPGERRGGRQRGTPNKKTALKDAIFCAAATQPNVSPLDFMLALMRDPKVPVDLRIEMAAAVAPLVHPRPKSFPKTRVDRFRTDFTARRVEPKLTPLGPEATGDAVLTPLDYLLSVMNDPEATPQQRIKAARVAARYRHAQADAEEMPVVIEDNFGFKIDLGLARSIRNDEVRQRLLYAEGVQIGLRGYLKGTPQGKAYERELAEIAARRNEHWKALKAVERPAGYTLIEAEKDEERLDEFLKRRRHREKLTREEDLEEAYLYARQSVPGPEDQEPRPRHRQNITVGEAMDMWREEERNRIKKNDGGAPGQEVGP